MNRIKVDNLMKFLYVIFCIFVVAGAYLKIMDYPVGDNLFTYSLILSFIFSSIEIQRLKRVIKEHGY